LAKRRKKSIPSKIEIRSTPRGVRETPLLVQGPEGGQTIDILARHC
jgi:hypothetical protein